MPHTRSAKKNLRKTEKRRAHNRVLKRTLKTYIKRFQAALEGPADKLQEEYNLAAQKLDKAAIRRIIHPNLAARKKSQMALAMRKKLTATPATPATGKPTT